MTTSPITTLQDEHALMASLVELMQQEQLHLIGADVDGLNAITPQKSQLVQQMAALAKRRHDQLGACGFGANDAGMQAWLDAHPEQDRSLWDRVLHLTREAKELNRVNGMLINKQMAHTQTLIQAMRTPAVAPDSAVYGPNGQTTGLTSPRRFVLG